MLFSLPEQARQMAQKSGQIIEIKVMAETQFPILTKQLAYCYRRSVFCKYDRFLQDGYRIYWQMTKTVQTAKQLLKIFQKFNQRRFPNIITDEETRVYYLEPVKKYWKQNIAK